MDVDTLLSDAAFCYDVQFSHPYKVTARMHFIQYTVRGGTIDVAS